jgi:hypothetical protein
MFFFMASHFACVSNNELLHCFSSLSRARDATAKERISSPSVFLSLAALFGCSLSLAALLSNC